MDSLKKTLEQSAKVLKDFIKDTQNLRNIKAAAELMVKSLTSGGKIISFGNGGSMCDSMHFAEELTGRFRDDRPAIAAISISDPAHITCVANDYGFDSIFSRFIEAHGKPEDVVLAISTSGNSENVLKACKAASNRGILIVALSGKSGGKLAELADIVIRVPFIGSSDRIQEVHIKVIHILIEMIEEGMKLSNDRRLGPIDQTD
jgi:D-sedoheptulose 7-phosphate isomerase